MKQKNLADIIKAVGGGNKNQLKLVEVNKKDTIEINRAWLERLLELANKVADPVTRDGWLPHLLGYIDSANNILKENE